MVRLSTLIILSLIMIPNLSAQELSDEEAIKGLLKMEDIGGKYTWDFDNSELKNLALEILADTSVEKTNKGILLLANGFTSKSYDEQNDKVFLKHIIGRMVRLDSIFEGADFLRNHFLRSDYDEVDLERISFYSSSQSILYWKKWTPYYLSFLELHGIIPTLKFLKKNIDDINQLYYSLYNVPSAYDTLDVNVYLARLGDLDDSIVVNQVEDYFQSKTEKDYKKNFERLSRIRTSFAFQKIGNYLISDLQEITPKKDRKIVRQMALAAYLAYVKNFPDRSTKWQDTFNLWDMVQYSQFHGKDYSSDEYMEIAMNWYIKNKDQLILDYNKY